jgi:hypothetical protein
MAIDVSYRDGFETSALDLSRLNKNIFKSSGVHTNNLGELNTNFSVIQQTVPNMTVQVLSGTADFYGADGETMYTFTTDSTENVTITPAVHTVGQTRIDIIVLKVDTSTKIATIEAIAGTPATTGSETVPTTPAGTYKLADISIVGGTTAITNAMITDRRTPINIYSRNSITGWNRIYQTGFEYQSIIGIKTSTDIDLTSFLGRGDKIRMEQVTSGVTFWNIKNINYNSTVANRTYIEFEQSGVANNVINSVEFSKNITPSGFNQFYLPYKTPEGQLIDGYIDVAVASNNLTVRVLHDTGVVPSTTRPVFINIGGVIRRITSALSVTANAGTGSSFNYLNLGGARIAGRDADLGVYLQFNSTTSSVNLLVARIVHGRVVGDFVNSNTNTMGAIGIINYNATDDIAYIGKFKARLSTSPHNWSSVGEIDNSTIRETRRRGFNIAYTGLDSMTVTVNQTGYLQYRLIGQKVEIYGAQTLTFGGTASGRFTLDMPFPVRNSGIALDVGNSMSFSYGNLDISTSLFMNENSGSNPNTTLAFRRADGTSNFTTGVELWNRFKYEYELI